MEKSIMHLLHENVTLGLSKIAVIVTAELIVTIDQVTNLVHHPLDLIHRAHLICVSIHDGNWHVTDFMQRDICGRALILTLLIGLREFLESAFYAILEKVSEGTRRKRVFLP